MNANTFYSFKDVSFVCMSQSQNLQQLVYCISAISVNGPFARDTRMATNGIELIAHTTECNFSKAACNRKMRLEKTQIYIYKVNLTKKI